MIVLVNFHESYPDVKSHIVRALNPEASPFVHCTLSFLGDDSWITANLTDEGVLFYSGRPDNDDTICYLIPANSGAFYDRCSEFISQGHHVSWLGLVWYTLTGVKPKVLCTSLPYFCLTGSMETLTLNELATWCAGARIGRGLPYRGALLADRI